LRDSQYHLISETKKLIRAISIAKTHLIISLCLLFLTIIAVGQYYNYRIIKNKNEELLFYIKRYDSVKNKINKEQIKISKKKREIASLERKVLKIDSEALAFAKIQTFFGELAENFSVNLESVRLSRTKQENNDLMRTTVYISCSGPPKNVLEFLNSVEKDLSKQGIVLREVNIHQKIRKTRNKTLYNLKMSLKVDIVWKKGRQSK